MNVQALEAIAESQNRLMNGTIDFCHASYIFSDRSHRDSVSGTQSAYQLSHKRFIPEFCRAWNEGYLQRVKASKCLPLLCQDYSTLGGIWNRMPTWSNPALRHCSIFCSTEGKRDGILVIYSLQKPI
jgi:hypothetical protein